MALIEPIPDRKNATPIICSKKARHSLQQFAGGRWKLQGCLTTPRDSRA